jgi:hypothetical protein
MHWPKQNRVNVRVRTCAAEPVARITGGSGRRTGLPNDGNMLGHEDSSEDCGVLTPAEHLCLASPAARPGYVTQSLADVDCLNRNLQSDQADDQSWQPVLHCTANGCRRSPTPPGDRLQCVRQVLSTNSWVRRGHKPQTCRLSRALPTRGPRWEPALRTHAEMLDIRGSAAPQSSATCLRGR